MKTQIELYGVVSKVKYLHAHGISVTLIEDKTNIEWEVLIIDKWVDTDILIEGYHIHVKGDKGFAQKQVFANYVDQWGRYCSHCGKHHTKGYYSENTGLYACSDECLSEIYTEQEIEEEREYEWLFWTEWE